jgi:hypothetical protein
MANLFTAIKIGSLENLKNIESRLNELGFNTHFLNNYSNMWTKNGTIVNCAYLYLDDNGSLHLSFIMPKFNRFCNWDCKDNIEAFLSFCALKGKTDFGKLFSYPITKIKKLPGYFPQTIGMDGNQIIKVGEKIYKYDKKDSELTRKIEFELSCEGANKDFIPHILEEQEIWDYYKLG